MHYIYNICCAITYVPMFAAPHTGWCLPGERGLGVLNTFYIDINVGLSPLPLHEHRGLRLYNYVGAGSHPMSSAMFHVVQS